MSTLNRRSLLIGGGALALAGFLTACSEEAPPPAVPTGPKAESSLPVVTAEQLGSYLEAIHSSLQQADEARDAALLAPRVVGSAARFRQATYEIIAKDDTWAQNLARPGASAVVPITSTQAEFPRTAMALAAAETEGAAPYFMILQQADARSPYTTWGWAQQAVGIDMPAVASPQVGGESVPADAADLVMTPADALALYASVLSNGDTVDPEDKLAPNPFQTGTFQQIQTERAELNAGVQQDEVATIHEEYAASPDEIAGMRTEDGGAIILGTLTSSRTVAIKDGAKVNYAEDNIYTRIIGRKEFSKEYVRDYGTTVALYIPAAAVGGQVQPIGATRTVLGAHGE